MIPTPFLSSRAAGEITGLQVPPAAQVLKQWVGKAVDDCSTMIASKNIM